MMPMTRRQALSLAAVVATTGTIKPASGAKPQGQITIGVHVSLAPAWMDPAQTSGIITPYMLLYALHDAMAKDLPGLPQAPCLAESWSVAEDGLAYDFVLREGVPFHNGEPVTAEDVKFSFERYHGASHPAMKERIAAVEIADPLHITFKLKRPWPDFLTFYIGATGAGWIVPRKYVERVGEDGFRKAPVGAGPYRFVSFNPGVELVLEAFEQYWRRPPAVKRVVLKVVPDEATRLAALKAGELDIAYSIRGELAEQLQRMPGLTLKPVVLQGTQWLYFPEQWDPKSPWHDIRVRRAANLALDRRTINEALTLGHSRITGGLFPDIFEFYWAPPSPVHDPAPARQLRAGRISERLRRRLCACDASYAISAPRPRQPRAKKHSRELRRWNAPPSSRATRREVAQHGPGRRRRVRQRRDAHGSLRGERSGLCLWRLPDIDALYPPQRSKAIMPNMQRSWLRCSRWCGTRRSMRLSGSWGF